MPATKTKSHDACRKIKSKKRVTARATSKPAMSADKPRPKRSERAGYDTYREKQAEISRERSASGRDIGAIPPVTDPARRAAGEKSLRAFLESYLAEWFPLAWSNDHLEAIKLLEITIQKGGRFALAMPRGSGKTTLCEGAAIWAALNGYRSFIVLIGAGLDLALAMLESIKTELETNELLAEDYPEVCVPIRALEGIANRCKGQTCSGERTRIGWTKKEIVLPTVKGSIASAVRIRGAGLTGSGIRGPRAKGPKGEILRPDLCIPDDPQTDKSARSPRQNAYRLRLVTGTMIGMAGPRKKIAAMCPCTPIVPGDMVDQLLNRARHPDWHGQRTSMMRKFPTNERLWDQYAQLRRDGMRRGDRGRGATEFYRANRSAMDAGAEASWPERFEPDELSAVQRAMNLRIDDEESFWSEYQCQPKDPAKESELEQLSSDSLLERLTGIPRREVPRDCDLVTAAIDVQAGVLYAMVTAWDQNFGGSPIDWLAFPAQNRLYFSANDPRPSLADVFPNLQQPARIYAGLKALVAQILGRAYHRHGGGADFHVDRCLIDAGFETDTVYQFCRQSPYAQRLFPAKGFGIGAKSQPMEQWTERDGERRGKGWILGFPESGKGRLVKIDTNCLGSFVAGRLLSADGTPGSIRLPTAPTSELQLLCDHLASEHRVQTSGRGRTLEEWSLLPGKENHWLDCLRMSAVAASIQGRKFDVAAAAGDRSAKPPERRRVSYKEARARLAGTGSP